LRNLNLLQQGRILRLQDRNEGRPVSCGTFSSSSSISRFEDEDDDEDERLAP
jgi:hypothetical protein